MVAVVRIPSLFQQNGVHTAELVHMARGFIAQVAMPVTIRHHWARWVQAQSVGRPMARGTKQHVSIALCSTSNCAWHLAD